MQRREFLAYGSAAALAGAALKTQADQQAEAQTIVNFELHLVEIYEELIDGEVVFALAYRDPVTRQVRPPIYVTTGQTVQIKLVNKTRKPRRFAITGYADDRFPVIPPGGSRTIGLPAPVAGSYIYHENSEGAVGRMLGLHGALVSMPANGRTTAGSETPYVSPTPAQSVLFDSLGTAPYFPGEKWLPNNPARTRIWLMGEIDPSLNQAAERNLPVAVDTLNYTFKARYFTLNGLSGYDASHAPSCCPDGYEGEPCLIRTMNAGICTHGPHIHGNHVYGLSDSDAAGKVVKATNVLEFDTWMLKPLQRKDVLLPFVKPDEIPHEVWPPRQEKFPLFYPMHCHIEMSQTAGGGNYPQGLVTHWEMLGPRRGA